MMIQKLNNPGWILKYRPILSWLESRWQIFNIIYPQL